MSIEGSLDVYIKTNGEAYTKKRYSWQQQEIIPFSNSSLELVHLGTLSKEKNLEQAVRSLVGHHFCQIGDRQDYHVITEDGKSWDDWIQAF